MFARRSSPSKSQIGRFKGMDEDQSDDQVLSASTAGCFLACARCLKCSLVYFEELCSCDQSPFCFECTHSQIMCRILACAAKLLLQLAADYVLQMKGKSGFYLVEACERETARDYVGLPLLQQDITRGRDMVDTLYQGAQSSGGTHNAIMSSQEYLSQVCCRPCNALDPPPACGRLHICLAGGPGLS